MTTPDSAVLGGWDQPAPTAGLSAPPTEIGTPLRRSPATLPGPRPGPDDEIDYTVVASLHKQVATYLSELRETETDAPLSVAHMRAAGVAKVADLVRQMMSERVRAGGSPLSPQGEVAWRQAVVDATFGLGRLQRYVDDPQVSNVDVYGFDDVVVEYAGGRLERVPPVFASDRELVEVIDRAARYAPLAREFSDRSPLLTTRLANGSRLTAQTLVSPRPGLTVRNHQFVNRIDLETLLQLGTIDLVLREVLRSAVRAGWNILISGEQGAGKTTMLRALCAETPPWDKLVVIEREAELQLEHLDRPGQVVPLEAQEANAEGAGEVDMTRLVVHALRMNAGRLILGEARSDEIVALLTAMSAGSRGAMGTIHANRPQDVFGIRIPSLAMMPPYALPVEFSALHAAAGLQLVVHISMDTDLAPDGTPLRRRRYVSSVAEVTGLGEGGTVASNEIFAAGPDGRAVPSVGIQRLDELRRVGFNAGLLSYRAGMWDRNQAEIR